MKLAVISHTEHYKKDGRIVGWGPTVREINELLNLFDEIWHIAPLYETTSPESSIPYISDKIHFVPINPTGGKTIRQKLNILLYAPATIKIVLDTLKKVDYWQFRAPTGIGVYLIPILSHFVKKPGWFKYAGNWKEANPPISYNFQRIWLSKINRRKVTINGRWPDQPAHCISFENPCLDNKEREEGLKLIEVKKYQRPYKICYVGRIEEEKGALRLIKALEEISPEIIDEVHFVGNGPKLNELRDYSEKLKIKCIIHGSLNRITINEIYKKCHFIILPSLASEGFPKVLAEAANYGCIPVSSDISSIDHYISNKNNGFIWEHKKYNFEVYLKELLENIEYENLKNIVNESYKFANKFTFFCYINKVNEIVLNAK
ncbi:glycosyltransferase [Thermaurantimonas aggregans]|uniref:glycosyltransferase n=1 Tax=Thermaurantimonas aggregans TaxID=2173829 RepID=UPI0023F3FD30|nr:glycosyltransferase [Thermaurantimonas aggregans]MCX8148588.1 glycosyltransferase [Thermaurantimonas aggregans]